MPCHHRPSRLTRVAVRALVAAVAGTALAVAGIPPPAASRPAVDPPSAVAYRPPVDAPVVDPFRPPPHPWAAGNRGLEYRTAPLTPVRAVADGDVVFAGSVAGTLHVTVRHADGLRSTVSFLAAVTVHEGRWVRQGDVLGWSGEVLHLGVRTPDGTYLDPAALFAGTPPVHLLPGGDDGTGGDDRVAGEPAVLLDLVRAQWPVAASAIGVDTDRLAARLRLWGHYAAELQPGIGLRRVVTGLGADLLHPEPCTPASTPVPRPGEGRILVLVGGLGSSSGGAAVDGVDTAALGYAPGDVLRFSYAGGRTPPPPGQTGPLTSLTASPYDAADSQVPLELAGDRLAALLAEVAATRPGVPIDVVAHSQGGVVARLALDDAGGGGRPAPAVATLVTLGSPHEGADLATAVAAVGGDPAGAQALASARQASGLELEPTSPAVAELSEVSPLIDRLRATPPPPGVRFTSVGARGDLVVPAGRTVPPAGPATAHTVVPLAGAHAHDDLPASAEARTEIARAVAGQPPTCRDAGAVVADLAVPELISGVEDRLGAVASGAGGLAPGRLPWSAPPVRLVGASPRAPSVLARLPRRP